MLDFTTVIAAPALAAMQERSDREASQINYAMLRARQHSLHPMQEDLLEGLLNVKCKYETRHEVSHPFPLQQKLIQRMFGSMEPTTTPIMGSDPRPLRQQPEPKVKISLRRRITDSADLTWQCEMAEEGPFVFEEVL